MNLNTPRIGIDVGSVRHRVAVGLPEGTLTENAAREEPSPRHPLNEVMALFQLAFADEVYPPIFFHAFQTHGETPKPGQVF